MWSLVSTVVSVWRTQKGRRLDPTQRRASLGLVLCVADVWVDRAHLSRFDRAQNFCHSWPPASCSSCFECVALLFTRHRSEMRLVEPKAEPRSNGWRSSSAFSYRWLEGKKVPGLKRSKAKMRNCNSAPVFDVIRAPTPVLRYTLPCSPTRPSKAALSQRQESTRKENEGDQSPAQAHNAK
ncbi:uncharacterized protein UHOD_11429 [Ustilago sp. UG-2017b]|nr:uncharacterized protein UHOD_11429 [Ustilago sp. UG-2017b]